MKSISTKNPRKYGLDELKDVRLDLDNVEFSKGWEDDPDNQILARYKPKAPLKARCSFCREVKDVFSIEGINFTAGQNVKNKVYHQTFLLVCKSCCTARQII